LNSNADGLTTRLCNNLICVRRPIRFHRYNDHPAATLHRRNG